MLGRSSVYTKIGPGNSAGTRDGTQLGPQMSEYSCPAPSEGRWFVVAKLRIQVAEEELADFCRRHHIRKLSVFGSVVRDDFTPEGDIDFLVEFEPEHVPGLITLTGMEVELSDLLGRRKVEMMTREGLSPYIRDEVIASARALYE